MKRKNGFTLIELLAVIVVLAIIALIATPIVMNTIKNSKKGAAERGADNYIKQVETSIMEYRLKNGSNPPDEAYDIDSETGNLVGSRIILNVEMNGTKPSSGSITIVNGEVNKEIITMEIGDYTVTYDTTKKTFSATLNSNKSPDEDNEDNVDPLCVKVDNINISNLQYGDKFTCELGDDDPKTFYVLNINVDSVSLIMNMNVDINGKGTTEGNTVAWSSNNDIEQTIAINYLQNSIKSWTKLDSSQVTLPTGKQISEAGGDSVWDGEYTGTVLSSWLYENLNSDLSGYWTLNASVSDGSVYANYLDYSGVIYEEHAGYSSAIGVRPVITISRDKLG